MEEATIRGQLCYVVPQKELRITENFQHHCSMCPVSSNDKYPGYKTCTECHNCAAGFVYAEKTAYATLILES